MLNALQKHKVLRHNNGVVGCESVLNMAFTLASDWDLSVANRQGQRVLGVEVKRKIEASPAWAARLRQNILAHGTFPKTPYFMMVFPDRLYLWARDEAQLDRSEPTYTIDARPILQPYFERADVTAEQISKQNLELIVAAWLGEMLHAAQPPDTMGVSQSWLMDSGLYDALAGGSFEYGSAA